MRTSLTEQSINVAPVDTHAAHIKYGGGPCVPAALAMVARAYGLHANMSDDRLVDAMAYIGGTPRQGGMPQEGKFAVLKHLGLRWELATSFDAAWLIGQLRAKRAVIAGGKRSLLPGGGGDEGHAIVINGVSPDGRTFFISDSTHLHNTPIALEQLRHFLEQRPGGPGTLIAVHRPAPNSVPNSLPTDTSFKGGAQSLPDTFEHVVHRRSTLGIGRRWRR